MTSSEGPEVSSLVKSRTVFSSCGFQTWKNANQAFREHESSTAHKDNALVWWNYSKQHTKAGTITKIIKDSVCRLGLCAVQQFRTNAAFSSFGEKTEQQPQELQLTDPRIPRARRPKKTAIWLTAMYIQFLARFLSYDILRHCRQHQWWNTKEVQPGNFLSLNEEICWFPLQAECAWSQKTWKQWKSIYWLSECLKVV